MELLHFSLKRLLEQSKDLTSFKCQMVSLLVLLNSFHLDKNVRHCCYISQNCMLLILDSKLRSLCQNKLQLWSSKKLLQ